MTSYEIKQKMDGVHRLVVEYNFNNSLPTDLADSKITSDPIVIIDSDTPTVEVEWKEEKVSNQVVRIN